jgi:hypothetical protein
MKTEWFAGRLRELCPALGVEVGEFAKEPAALPEPSRGRPRKEPAQAAGQKRPRGRPRTEQTVPLDLHATESATLDAAPGHTDEEVAGGLPPAQEKPRGRKRRR